MIFDPKIHIQIVWANVYYEDGKARAGNGWPTRALAESGGVAGVKYRLKVFIKR